MIKRPWLIAAFAVCALSATAADRVQVALDWTPNTNHSGLFAAQAYGYFEDEGLEVELIEPSPTVSLQLLTSGRVDVAVSMQEYVTMARAEGMDVISVAALYPHNTSGFAALSNKGVSSPADFAGLRYGGWGSDLETVMVQTVMKNAGAAGRVDDVEWVNLGTIDFVTAALADLADVFWIYYGWQGVRAEQAGLDFVYLPLVDLAPELDYYTPVLATRGATLAEKPDVVRRFLRAAARGYLFAATQPDEAAAALLAAAPELDAALVLASQRWLADHSETNPTRWGVQELNVWEVFADWAFANGLIRTPIDPAAAFSNDYLPSGEDA
ncbi:MAG: ABC transporter substrate-binding protein [Candidatus Bipolaricaulota bacterium]